MPIYNYNNGNFSSTTNIVNGVAYTQNVTMLGGNNGGCGDNNVCPQGYSLYFPCLKNITRGEDVCFDFYVSDNEKQDTVDTRTIDGLTINLNGRFGCSLGTYQYPGDYISNLQTEDYKIVSDETFKPRDFYRLNLFTIDDKGNTLDYDNCSISGKIGVFESGSTSTLIAEDTELYYFVGWIDIDNFDEECGDYLSKSKKLNVYMDSDKNIAAVYSKRKEINIFNKSKSCADFKVYRTNDLNNEVNVILDGLDYVIRVEMKLGYYFDSWEDGDKRLLRNLEDLHYGTDGFKDFKIIIDANENSNNRPFDSVKNLFKEYGYVVKSTPLLMRPTENIISNFMTPCEDIELSSFFEFLNLVDYDNISFNYIYDECVLLIGDGKNNGYFEISNPGNESKTIVRIFCRQFSGMKCSLLVEMDNEYVIEREVTNGSIDFEFNKSDYNKIRISALGDFENGVSKPTQCIITRIVILDEVVKDKGKMTLCLPGSITSTFHKGQITANGAISINGSAHGLPCTQIGSVIGGSVINII